MERSTNMGVETIEGMDKLEANACFMLLCHSVKMTLLLFACRVYMCSYSGCTKCGQMGHIRW